MTIIEAINRVDAVKPNGFHLDEKICWLSRLDGIVKSELHDVHMNDIQTVFEGYDGKSLTKELFVPHPYDEVYLRYLESQIDYASGEYEKYNNSILLFNAAWEAYQKFYHRTHRPRAKDFVHF